MRPSRNSLWRLLRKNRKTERLRRTSLHSQQRTALHRTTILKQRRKNDLNGGSRAEAFARLPLV